MLLAGTFCCRLFIPFFVWIVFVSKSVYGASKKECTLIDQCSCQLKDGGKISLWPIDNKNGPRFIQKTKQGTTFSYSPCTIFTPSTNPGKCENVLICQADTQLVGYIPLALAFPNTMVPMYDESSNEYIFKYTGSHYNEQTILKSMVKLKCDMNAVTPRITNFIQSTPHTYETTLTSKYACPVGRKGLSTGSILCIVFFSIVFVYLVVGVVINKFVFHKDGSEMVPHKSFWCELPGYVKDGFVFVFRKIKGTGGQYEVLS